MKYMGSKKNMLLNGLGVTFQKEVKGKERIVDLFSGSASVSWFAAMSFETQVIAVDLQKFSEVLANSVIKRTERINPVENWKAWQKEFTEVLKSNKILEEAERLDRKNIKISSWARKARTLCSEVEAGLIWSAYGGYYYSPYQALTFDLLLNTLPKKESLQLVAKAAIISAASQCAAAPGHTAQPFKPNKTAGPFLKEAWERNPLEYVESSFKSICKKYAKVKGEAFVKDAVDFSKGVNEKDLVFLDPPYSGVHYSRFYHVLETIARGDCGQVSGTGRYPPFEERPASSFSRKSESKESFKSMMTNLSKKGARIILTYPNKECSNGLSGEFVKELCSELFTVRKKVVETNFSTLGGNNKVRSARKKTGEMILVLE